jgi:hypothetical protein
MNQTNTVDKQEFPLIGAIERGLITMGRHIGTPALKIIFGDEQTGNATPWVELYGKIEERRFGDVLFTGHDPISQVGAIGTIFSNYAQQARSKQLRLHLMSCGTRIVDKQMLTWLGARFHYMAFFPPTEETAFMLNNILVGSWWEVGAQSDIIIEVDMIHESETMRWMHLGTMIMPKPFTNENMLAVYQYCVENNKRMGLSLVK